MLHEHNVILTIETAQTPRVDLAERVRMETISDKFAKVRLRFGFMESPNVPKALAIARKLGWQFDIMSTSFFVSRRSLKPSAQSGMPRWQDHLFIALSRSANDATDYFQIPDRAGGRSRHPGHHLNHVDRGRSGVTLIARYISHGMAPKIGLGYALTAQDYKPRALLHCAVKHFRGPSSPMTSDVAAPAPETAAANGHGDAHSTAGFGALTLGSIGVVYGDIGTSPLYALREAVIAASGPAGASTPQAGARRALADPVGADRRRDAQICRDPAARRQQRRGRHAGADGAGAARASARGAGAIVLLGIISGALFYGDAVITPALSVLSAVEGIKLVTPAFDPYVVPLTVVILLVLFAVQSRGTAASPRSSARSCWSGSSSSRSRRSRPIARHPERAAGAQSALRRVASCSTTASSASSRWARCFSPSPAPRRSMPISAISASGRSRPPGCSSCCRRWR